MGSYPTVVDWNNDGYHDLLVGNTNGDVYFYKNTNDNTNPVLDGGTFILNTGYERASVEVGDWNGDGNKDIVIGTLTGNVQVYLNQSTDTSPYFGSFFNVQVGGIDFDLTTSLDRSAPRIYDWNGDGLKDLLVGEVYGKVFYLRNEGTNNVPVFNSSEQLLLNDGLPLTYPGGAPRSRIYITDWNNDGFADILSGGSDGKIMYFAAVAPEPMSTTLFIAGSVVLGLSRLRKRIRDNNK